MHDAGDSFDAEGYLDSLEAIGWRFGLERMNALCDQLGRPQDRFESIHVVGTNGKSSVTRMTAAALGAEGLRTGCLVSPHLSSWSERVLLAGREPEPAVFADSVRKTAAAAAAVNRGLASGDSVTQFEVSTAAGFLLMADSGVEVAVVEAGLGGRLDASNTIDSTVTVLTSVGLDHTEWLGGSELEIASEKLAVLRSGTVLVLGPVTAEVRDLALETAARLRCRVVEPGPDPPAGVEPRSPALYQRGNLAIAIAAAGQYLASAAGSAGGGRWTGGGRPEPGGPREPDPVGPRALEAAAAAAAVPGRLEQVADDPPVFVDVAHNREAAAALALSLPGIAQGSPVVAVVAILDDKDAEGIITELAPVLEHAVFTGIPSGLLAGSARPGARSHPPAELVDLAKSAGIGAEARPLPSEALDRAVVLARDLGGIVVVAGSHYTPVPGRPA